MKHFHWDFRKFFHRLWEIFYLSTLAFLTKELLESQTRLFLLPVFDSCYNKVSYCFKKDSEGRGNQREWWEKVIPQWGRKFQPISFVSPSTCYKDISNTPSNKKTVFSKKRNRNKSKRYHQEKSENADVVYISLLVV